MILIDNMIFLLRWETSSAKLLPKGNYNKIINIKTNDKKINTISPTYSEFEEM